MPQGNPAGYAQALGAPQVRPVPQQGFFQRLINPGPASSYNPTREAMLAQMLQRSTAGGGRNWGEVLGNLAQQFVAQRGLKQQAQAREQGAAAAAQRRAEELAGVLGGLGAPVSAEQAQVLGENPNVMGEVLERTRPQEPQQQAEPKTLKAPDGNTYWITGPNAGQRVLPGVEAPPEAEPERRIVKGADGFNYFADTGERVLPGVEAPAAAPERAPAFKPTNVTMPDGSTRLVLSAEELATARNEGATLPAGSTQQRPMTEVQMRANLAVQRMEPALQELFTPGEGGKSLYDTLGEASQRAAANIPGAGNFLVSPEFQRAENLIREAVGAGLRFETGAAITQQEVEDQLHRYAPRPGDTPQTIQQKQQALMNFMQAVQSMVPQPDVPGGMQPGGQQYEVAQPGDDPLGLFQ